MIKLHRCLFYISALFFVFYFWGCADQTMIETENGVSLQLAQLRDNQISDITYHLFFNIPDSVQKPITGKEKIEFHFVNTDNKPLVLDFRNPGPFITSVKLNDRATRYKFSQEHLIIASSKLNNGKNTIEIEFIAGDRAMNRNNDYLYTLFVPDRACTAFPCFDQPSLKARFVLELEIPAQWTATGNADTINTVVTNVRSRHYFFKPTEPISTYLFSFVAGKFQSITRSVNNMEITMYHRESDPKLVERNADKIFGLHFSSIQWLEKYTGIDYPFSKFDFVAIPSFQYSGMEHPGAILYRDSKLFLDESASVRDELNRANLIAHETAHIWFGDLVTMKWFSEVWLKEVFANFMAGKIINPQFPEVNHKLNFLINHYPLSYAIDRTNGANPIGQPLSNMKDAGTLYGPIIYHKAPIIMEKLEDIIQEENLKEGLQEYLGRYKYGNAGLEDLIDILDNKTTENLKEWGHSWIFEPGMPHYTVQRAFNEHNKLQSVLIEQIDPMNKGRQWPQKINVLIADKKSTQTYTTWLKDTFNLIILDEGQFMGPLIFANADGQGYGFFKQDSISIMALLTGIQGFTDPVMKCSGYITLWENMLNQNLLPDKLLGTYKKCLEKETDPQNIALVLDYIQTIYWRFLSKQQRKTEGPELEAFLWKYLQQNNTAGIKSSFLKTYKSIAVSAGAIANLYGLWDNTINIDKLTLSENDLTELAFELMVKSPQQADTIFNIQYKRVNNEERKKRLLFIQPALSSQETIRGRFFKSLMDEANREKEPWVIDALQYFHHPAVSEKSIRFIRPSLDILEELQITGDIFFPKQWLDATFNGHSSINAVTEINIFFNENPGFPVNLKNKILQSADLVYRASIINKE